MEALIKEKEVVFEAWKDHSDPSGFMKATHNPNNALLIWWFNPKNGKFIKTKDANLSHSTFLNDGSIEKEEVKYGVRGRVFKYDGINYLIIYFPSRIHLNSGERLDLLDKVVSSVNVPITRIIDDNGDDLSDLFEQFDYMEIEKSETGKFSAKEVSLC